MPAPPFCFNLALEQHSLVCGTTPCPLRLQLIKRVEQLVRGRLALLYSSKFMQNQQWSCSCRQDVSRTCLAHHELESVVIIINNSISIT